MWMTTGLTLCKRSVTTRLPSLPKDCYELVNIFTVNINSWLLCFICLRPKHTKDLVLQVCNWRLGGKEEGSEVTSTMPCNALQQTYPCGWRTANRFSRLSRVSSRLCCRGGTLLGVWLQVAEEGVEVADQGEEAPCKVPIEAKVGEGGLGRRAQLHYAVENQRPSALMGCVGPKLEAGTQSWLTVAERGLCQ